MSSRASRLLKILTEDNVNETGYASNFLTILLPMLSTNDGTKIDTSRTVKGTSWYQEIMLKQGTLGSAEDIRKFIEENSGQTLSDASILSIHKWLNDNPIRVGPTAGNIRIDAPVVTRTGVRV